MATTTQTPERIEALNNALSILKQAQIQELNTKERMYFLAGFCLGKFNEDIIYQMCYSFGRDLIDELEKFLKDHNGK